MAQATKFRSGLMVTAVLLGCSSILGAAEGIISKNPDASGNYCHLRFPAITEDTLFTDRPVLKDPNEGDIIDFYGPCNHNPIGTEEVLRQRADMRRDRDRRNSESG